MSPDGIATVAAIVGASLLHFFIFGRKLGAMEEKLNIMFDWWRGQIAPLGTKATKDYGKG